MKDYVLGFMIDVENNNVLLIRKTKPKWQAGKFNGIGGKVEEGESYLEAMVREFKEETDIDAPLVEWRKFARLKEIGKWHVECFVLFDTLDRIYDFKQTTDEQPVIWPVTQLSFYKSILPNLKWLIPLAMDTDDISAPTFVYRKE